MKHTTDEIRKFVLNNVREHPKDIAAFTASHFGISRQAVLKHINKLISDEMISVEGEKNKREYKVVSNGKLITYPLPGIDESDIFNNDIMPLIRHMPKEFISKVNYCFTEMVNNANDHSEGTELNISLTVSNYGLIIKVNDNGIGIFRKIAQALNLSNEQYAILELAKGKFTTDKKRHSGEGIFFTSKISDYFNISSYGIDFTHDDNDIHTDLIREDGFTKGTDILFMIDINSEKDMKAIFNQYADEDFGFTKTAVEVGLLRVGEENLVSRSQAKRLLARFEQFKHILLDFRNVDTIGQAFADEIFRVFANEHPDIVIETTNTTKDVDMMIKRARNRRDETF